MPFPSNPATNDTYIVNDIRYVFDGIGWSVDEFRAFGNVGVGTVTLPAENGTITTENGGYVGDNKAYGAPEAKPIVIVYDGQSNAASSNINAVGGDLTVDSGIKCLTSSLPAAPGSTVFDIVTCDPQNGVLGNVPQQPLHAGKNMDSFAFAKEFRKRHSQDVILINASQISQNGGDAISEWVSAGTASPNYDSLKFNVESGLALLPDNTEIDYFLWFQGESDNANTYSGYKSDFETLLSQLRGETWFNFNTPVIAFELEPTQSRNDYWSTRSLSGEDPAVGLVSNFGVNYPDGLHSDGASKDIQGARSYYVSQSLPKISATSLNYLRGDSVPNVRIAGAIQGDLVYGAQRSCTYRIDGTQAYCDALIRVATKSAASGDVDIELNTPFSFDAAATTATVTFVSFSLIPVNQYRATIVNNGTTIRLLKFDPALGSTNIIQNSDIDNNFLVRIRVNGATFD